MTDSLAALHQGLARQLAEGRVERDKLWTRYWEGRRMVTVPDNTIEVQGNTTTGIAYTNAPRFFESFPNLAPKNAEREWTVAPISWVSIVRACIARLKNARAKESTNRNLSTLLVVIVKVQKDLESLIGDDGQREDAEREAQVTRDDRSL
jgi:hypothetical protein